MADFRIKDDRLVNWTDEKKIVENRLNINFRINVNQETEIKYRITPWSVWWFDIGENVGTETGGHVYTDPSKISHKRPCIVISTNKFHNESFNAKVVIMPLTSKKAFTKIRHFHYELNGKNYQGFFDKNKFIKYEGLNKDSLVICNEIKTIDTKRLTQAIYPALLQNDVTNIQTYIKKYLSIN